MYWFCPHLISFLPSFSLSTTSHLGISLSWLSDGLILTSPLISLTSPWLSQLSSLGACHFSTCLPEVTSLSPWLNAICFSYIIYFNPHKNPMIQVLLSLSPLCRRRNRLIKKSNILLNSVQFSCSVVSDSLWPHGLQHTRLPCPSPTPGACSNSCPLSQWCHPTISSSVIPFISHFQFFPASGSFQISQLFASGSQSIGISASTSVLPMNIQDFRTFPLGLTSWLSLQSKGLSRVFSNTTVQKHQFFGNQLSLQSSSHIHTWQLEKP